ncbi:DNA recombination protein RmuC [Spiroplasma tabanidicola]|uniref:DNA recombination protein RmuC n=1 Tax=Spiroplasma tabanidicola TaxID=324079 RepID=A0A6I6C8S3_9MOLU|nr:DNA recombination protein RmuC [Spiroplasma tabanidicola]QGS52066.1 DNA recombination protein RmuC [Spiroplasma tabanidicola]
MQTVIIVLLSIVIILISIFMIIFFTRKSNVKIEGVDKNDIEILKRDLELENEKRATNINTLLSNIISEQKNTITKSESDLKTFLSDISSKSDKNLNDTERQVRDFILKQANETKNKLDSSTTKLEEALKAINEKTIPISEVKEKVSRLDNLLSQNNKAGKAGEYMLERILSNIVNLKKSDNILYEAQYKMIKKTNDNKSLIVDLFIKGDSTKFINIPVDAKFPFNAFEKLSGLDLSSEEYKKYLNEFINDCKNRIKETEKYISEEDKTVYSVMFVPSEGIFSFLCEQTQLIDYAFKSKVIIAGPSTLTAIIYSIDNYMNLFEMISSYDKKIDILKKILKYIENYDEEMTKLFEIIKKLHDQYLEVMKKDNSLKKMYKNLSIENNIKDDL